MIGKDGENGRGEYRRKAMGEDGRKVTRDMVGKIMVEYGRKGDGGIQ